MSDIFISYDREDQKSAEAIAEALEQAGWSLWWDRQLHYGEHFDDVIERELNLAKCVIVLWSGQSVQSQYVKAEAVRALKLEKLIPVVIEEVELPLRFEGVHTSLLLGWDGSASSAAFQSLLEGVAGMVGRPQKRAKGQKASRSSTDDWGVDNFGVLVKEVTPSSTEGWAKRNERILFDALQKLVRESEKGFLGASIGKYWINFSAEGRGDAMVMHEIAVSNAYLPRKLHLTDESADRLISMGFEQSADDKYRRSYRITDNELRRVARNAVTIFREIYGVNDQSRLKLELVL